MCLFTFVAVVLIVQLINFAASSRILQMIFLSKWLYPWSSEKQIWKPLSWDFRFILFCQV